MNSPKRRIKWLTKIDGELFSSNDLFALKTFRFNGRRIADVSLIAYRLSDIMLIAWDSPGIKYLCLPLKVKSKEVFSFDSYENVLKKVGSLNSRVTYVDLIYRTPEGSIYCWYAQISRMRDKDNFDYLNNLPCCLLKS